MALKYYKNKETGVIKRSLKKLPEDQWIEQLSAPNQKMMIAANASTGTSKIKDSKKQLTARARNYARDVDIDDDISLNKANGLEAQVRQSLLNEKGQRRKKIDDI